MAKESKPVTLPTQPQSVRDVWCDDTKYYKLDGNQRLLKMTTMIQMTTVVLTNNMKNLSKPLSEFAKFLCAL